MLIVIHVIIAAIGTAYGKQFATAARISNIYLVEC